jgi:hypothetical protein
MTRFWDDNQQEFEKKLNECNPRLTPSLRERFRTERDRVVEEKVEAEYERADMPALQRWFFFFLVLNAWKNYVTTVAIIATASATIILMMNKAAGFIKKKKNKKLLYS